MTKIKYDRGNDGSGTAAPQADGIQPKASSGDPGSPPGPKSDREAPNPPRN